MRRGLRSVVGLLSVAGMLVLAASTGAVAPAQAGGAGVTHLLALNTFANSGRITDVTPDNSYLGGDPFSAVSAGSFVQYGTQGGRRAAQFSTADPYPSRSFVAYGPGSLGSDTTEIYASAGVYLEAWPTSGFKVMKFRDDDGDEAGSVKITEDGLLRVCAPDLTDAAVCSSPTTTSIPTGQWVRVDAYLKIGSGDGAATARLFDDPSSATETDSTSLTDVDTGDSALDGVRFGITSATPGVSGVWLDTLRLADRWPGPYASPGSPVTESEDFEDGTTGYVNRCVSCVVSSTAPLDGGGSLAVDAGTGPSYAQLTQALWGTDKRYADISFEWEYTNPSAVVSTNQPILTLRNTSEVAAHGGNHFNMWADATTGTIRGDLASTDSFDSGSPFVAGVVYDFRVIVGYGSDQTSRAQVWIDGAEVADFTSTTNAEFGTPDLFRGVVLGSNGANADYRAEYDEVSITTSNDSLF